MAPHKLYDVSDNESSSMTYPETHPLEAIAVVGMATGFPQEATSPEALWKVIMERRSTATRIPESRMDIGAMYHPDADRRGQVSVNRGHFLAQDLAAFDAPFFSTSTTDAASMDPQQRLLLEYTYLALENAGIPMERVAGSRTSVYTGSFSTDWQQLVYRDAEECATTAATGATLGLNANRISWFFDFFGPSANLDTACSSSLVCLDLGCHGLRSGNEDMSIVAGSNIILSPDGMHSLSNLNMLSSDGECYSFDSRANGYSRGEGIGVLVLKRVTDAIRDGDTIRGIIRNSGCNQDGRTPSVTLPNAISQAALIRQCYDQAGLSTNPVRFFEAHGTGTPVGDPTEVTGFGSIFRHDRTVADPLWVGAIKSNLGHLEGASGIAGVVKTLLVLEKGIIPPNNNFDSLNSQIDAEFLRLRFPTEPTPWPAQGLRRASVNSFGNGGTNAHVILDDVYHYLEARGLKANHHTVREPPSTQDLSSSLKQNLGNTLAIPLSPRLLPLSAADEAGIMRQAKQYAAHFKTLSLGDHEQQQYLDNLAFSLAYRRSRLAWKSFAVVESLLDLCNLDKLVAKPRTTVTSPGVGYVFTGQGAQWAGMARELSAIPAFHNTLVRLETYLASFGCPWNLSHELLNGDDVRISNPEYSQTLCTAVQLALVDLLDYYGVLPQAVVGHSSGEIAAAYCVGAISDCSAIKVAYFRGKLASTLTKEGSAGMLSANVSSTDAAPYILRAAQTCGSSPAVVVACINSPGNVTLSGDAAQLQELEKLLNADAIFNRRLAVNVAYHSPQMQEVAEEYRRQLGHLDQGIRSDKPVTMFSSLTGLAIEQLDDLCKADYWVQNMVSPVRFTAALSSLCSRRAHRAAKKLDLSHRKLISLNMLIEIGPHAALQRPVNDTLADIPGAADISYASCLSRKADSHLSFLRLIGQVHCTGYDVNFERVNCPMGKPQVSLLTDLPGYVFDHSKRYWEESRISAQYRQNTQAKLDLLGKPVADWNPLEPRWRNHLRTSEMPWMEDHVINGSLIYPGAGMLVMAIEAMNQMADKRFAVEGFELKDVAFVRSISIPQTADGIETQLCLRMPNASFRTNESWCTYRLFTFEKGTWQECCHGAIRPKYQEPSDASRSGNTASELESLDLLKKFESICRTPLDPSTLYAGLSGNGLALGPSFQRVKRGGYHQSKIVASVEMYQWPESDFPQTHIVHPTTLDAIFHIAIGGYAEGGNRVHDTMIPTSLGRLFVHNSGLASHDREEVQECAWLHGETRRWTKYSGIVFDRERTHVLAEFTDMECTKIGKTDEAGDDDDANPDQKAYHVRHLADVEHLSASHTLLHCDKHSDSSIFRYVELLAHKNTDLEILAVGAAVKPWEATILRGLTDFTDATSTTFSRYRHYRHITGSTTVPEISDAAFEGLPGASLEPASVADVCQNAAANASFDIIFLPLEMHVDGDTMHHIQKAMAPEGKLIFYSEHQDSHWPDVDALSNRNIILRQANTDFAVYELSSRNKASQLPAGGSITIVYDRSCAEQQAFCTDLSSFMQQHGFEAEALDLRSASESARVGRIYISLLEINKSFLYDVSEEEFGLMQVFFRNVEDVLWLNRQGGSSVPDPRYCLIQGIARVLQREQEALQMTTLALEKSQRPNAQQLEGILKIIHGHLDASPGRETEYVEIDGLFTVPRIFPSQVASEEIRSRCLRQATSTSVISTAPALKLEIGTAGVLDTLHFVEDDAVEADVLDDEIEIQVKAIGLNGEDSLIAQGRDSGTSAFGQECAGIVTRAGSKSGFVPGNRVLLGSTGLFKTLARGKAVLATKIPTDVSFATAAAIPVQFGTAWEAIIGIARLRKDESILVTAAATGTGQAAIQLAKMLEAAVYATVDSDAQTQLLVEQYNIPPEHILKSHDAGFSKALRALNNGRGVDVVVNSLSGEQLFTSMACIASFGRFINLNAANAAADAVPALAKIAKNVSFTSFDLASFLQERPYQVQCNLRAIVEKFEHGVLRAPVAMQVFDISEVKDAMRVLSEGTSSGRVVVEVNDDSRVEMTLQTKPSFYFSPDATYVIAGGLGGLGRATARWMAGRSARNLVLLSRSGPRTDSARELIKELETQGVHVEAPACDVTNLDRVQEVFEELSNRLPPIKGCVQGSIVARDGLFDGLSWQDWHIPVNAKTVGSWNLHTVLPSGMDFFIFLASASGLGGTRGQTNYNAGNCYEDALARFRVSQGEKAVALDLGAMRDDGILAEDPELLNRVLGYGSLEPISRETYYALLDYYCNPALTLTPDESQVGFGLGLGGGEGLESFNYDKHPMMYPLQIYGERQARQSGRGNISGNTTHQRDFRKDFMISTSLEDASNVVAEATVDKLSKSLSTLDNWDVDQPLQAYGVDSLLAVELRNWIAKEFGADIAVFDVQGASTLGTLGFLVAGKSKLKHEGWTT